MKNDDFGDINFGFSLKPKKRDFRGCEDRVTPKTMKMKKPSEVSESHNFYLSPPLQILFSLPSFFLIWNVCGSRMITGHNLQMTSGIHNV